MTGKVNGTSNYATNQKKLESPEGKWNFKRVTWRLPNAFRAIKSRFMASPTGCSEKGLSKRTHETSKALWESREQPAPLVYKSSDDELGFFHEVDAKPLETTGETELERITRIFGGPPTEALRKVEELIPAVDSMPSETLTETEVKNEIGKAGYRIEGLIGGGGTGSVYRATHAGNEYAVKIIAPEMALKEALFAVSDERGEALALSFPEHENLIKTYGIFTYNTETGGYRYVTERSTCSRNEVVVGIVTELVDDSEELFDYVADMVDDGEKTGIEAVRGIGRQIAMSVAAMHGKNFLHRDLKLENVLINKEGQIKLIDFGFARYLPRIGSRTGTGLGTVGYVAPEIIRGESYSRKVDVWALGVLLLTLGYQKPIFDVQDDGRTMRNILAYTNLETYFEDREWFAGWPIHHDSDFRDLVSRCLDPNPTTRISMEEVSDHPFFRISLEEPLEGLSSLDVSADGGITTGEALKQTCSA